MTSSTCADFEPDADTAAVKAAAEQAVPVLEAENVRVDLETQDVARAPHVRTRFTVTTAPGPDALLAALPALDRRFGTIPHADWTVQATPEGSLDARGRRRSPPRRAG
ncbi:hypothetical protein G5V59_19725 [Nocardioides sp. W3-2-3]|uniref:hypothetical protein n=1 Tax=Nocardioides convexus TaxID=2712224 RepID=UPI0024189874|nr:hypothetical protein [Nocardioides convexus]NHA01321.1 hypothetical protein [Nocardioides convexus]